MPVSFGYHPYLRLPGVDGSEWQVEMPVRERLELDDRMLPTGERAPVRVEAGPLGVEDLRRRLPRAGRTGRRSYWQGGGRRIELTVGPGYRFAQVYAPSR